MNQQQPLVAFELSTRTLRIESVYQSDGLKILSTRMKSGTYSEYEYLPDAILFEGEVFGKSSWNSDTLSAVYRNDRALGFAV